MEVPIRFTWHRLTTVLPIALSVLTLTCIGPRLVTITSVPQPTDRPTGLSASVEVLLPRTEHGPAGTPIELDAGNLDAAFRSYLLERGTFSAITDTPMADVHLEFRLNEVLIQDAPPSQGFIYLLNADARLFEKLTGEVRDYSTKQILPGPAIRLFRSQDQSRINDLVNRAFRDVCRQVEYDFARRPDGGWR